MSEVVRRYLGCPSSDEARGQLRPTLGVEWQEAGKRRHSRCADDEDRRRDGLVGAVAYAVALPGALGVKLQYDRA